MDDKSLPAANMIDGPNGPLAYLRQEGRGPGLLWLGGYASDMRGSKAEAIAAHAANVGQACTRFDYTGHGESSGDFEEGTISAWAADAAYILTAVTDGPQLLIGSSMGGWIAGLLARAHPEKIAGLVLLAPAPDFTEGLPLRWTEAQRETLERDGRLAIPSDYDDTEMVYTKRLIEDGATRRVLTSPLSIAGPVRILQGMKDDAVPWQYAVQYGEHIQSPDITTLLIKDGDHRLSSDENIARLIVTVREVTTLCQGSGR